MSTVLEVQWLWLSLCTSCYTWGSLAPRPSPCVFPVTPTHGVRDVTVGAIKTSIFYLLIYFSFLWSVIWSHFEKSVYLFVPLVITPLLWGVVRGLKWSQLLDHTTTPRTLHERRVLSTKLSRSSVSTTKVFTGGFLGTAQTPPQRVGVTRGVCRTKNTIRDTPRPTTTYLGTPPPSTPCSLFRFFPPLETDCLSKPSHFRPLSHHCFGSHSRSPPLSLNLNESLGL